MQRSMKKAQAGTSVTRGRRRRFPKDVLDVQRLCSEVKSWAKTMLNELSPLRCVIAGDAGQRSSGYTMDAYWETQATQVGTERDHPIGWLKAIAAKKARSWMNR